MSFLYPTAFWFALTLPVVVACYLLKRRRKTELIPASLLWNRFLAENQANAPFQKLKRHTLLILQLCMLLLAILALSAPFFRTHRFASEMLIVLIDTSASMQSTDVAPSRMHQAHEAVEELIATMDGNDQMMLIAAGNPTRVIQSATSSHADLRRALKHLQSTDTATRLSEGLKLAATLAEGIDHVQIHLFTDGAVGDLTDTTLSGIDLVYHPLGTRGNNVGIVSMDIRPNPDDVSSRAIFTSIANYSNASKNLILELRFEDQLLEARAMTIEAGATSSVNFIAPQERAGCSMSPSKPMMIWQWTTRPPKSASCLSQFASYSSLQGTAFWNEPSPRHRKWNWPLPASGNHQPPKRTLSYWMTLNRKGFLIKTSWPSMCFPMPGSMK